MFLDTVLIPQRLAIRHKTCAFVKMMPQDSLFFNL